MFPSARTRRRFLRGAGAMSAALSVQAVRSVPGATVRPSAGAPQPAADRAACLDYRQSFICGTSELNSVRLQIESRTLLTDLKTGQTTEFLQAASCKSENTFGDRNLFYTDNYDFLPIFGDSHWLIFRRTARLNEQGYRQVVPSPNAWGEPRLLKRPGRQPRVLQTWEDIRDTTASGAPLVAQIRLTDDSTKLSALIECPVKTMNISHEKRMYQIDTGPVGLPDLSRRTDRLIDCLRLAFVAFNQPHFADFVIEQPTPVIEDGKECCRIHHYSGPISLTATNSLLTHD